MKKAVLILMILASSFLGMAAQKLPGPNAGFIFHSSGWYAPDKSAASVLDYTIDWSLWLATDTISASTWTAETGITVSAIGYTDTTATVWLSGGTAGTTYRVTNRITTAGGRITELSFFIRVRNL